MEADRDFLRSLLCGNPNSDNAPADTHRERLDPKTGKWTARPRRLPHARQKKATWPMTSHNIGVDEEDVEEARRIYKEKGSRAEVDNEGGIVFATAGIRREHCKIMGYYDRNAGYGDPTPDNC